METHYRAVWYCRWTPAYQKRGVLMDIEKLEHFLIFTEYMNFTAAANKAFMDTSVFHRQISSIEHELNVQLIKRDNRAMSLTEAGESFAEGVRKILELYHVEVQKAVSLDSGDSGTIRICNVFNHSMAPRMTAVLNQFAEQYPNINIVIISKPLGESFAVLQKGDVDFTVARGEDFEIIDDMEMLKIEKIRAGFAIHNDLLPKSCRNEEDFREEMLDNYPMVWCKELLTPHSKAYIQEREERLGKGSVIYVDNREATYTYTELKKGFTLIIDMCYFRYQPGIRYFRSKRFSTHYQSLIRKVSNTNASAALMWDFMWRKLVPDSK